MRERKKVGWGMLSRARQQSQKVNRNWVHFQHRHWSSRAGGVIPKLGGYADSFLDGTYHLPPSDTETHVPDSFTILHSPCRGVSNGVI